jgi:hypothetical protein
MSGHRRGFLAIIMPIVLGLLLITLIPFGGAHERVSAAQPTAPDSFGRVSGDHLINVALWVINVYQFDYRAGSYTFDFYLFFFWTDSNITTVDWYIMNGLPSSPTSKAMVTSGLNDSYFFEIWRVRADLSVPLEPVNYPFDQIKLPISMEVIPHGYNTTLNWMTPSSGVDPGFKIVGWTIRAVDYFVAPHQYPLDIVEPQAVMTIVMEKSTFVAFMQTILPPLIFCIVSGFSYLFRMDNDGDFSLRIGINTSMLITAVLFNISTTSNIPPISQFNLYTTFITAVMTFLSVTLIVTVYGYFEWRHIKRHERIKKINQWGAVLAVGLPMLIFLAYLLANYG